MLPVVLVFLFLLVVSAGTVLLMRITKEKWGYTEKREKELEREVKVEKNL